MKVDRTGSTSKTSPRSRARGTDSVSGAFREHLDGVTGAAENAGAVEGSAPVASFDALLALQSTDGAADQEARRRTVQRGEDILDRLEEIRHGLLLGKIEPERLMQLASLVRARRGDVADPRLSALLDEIELRAEVELAKLSRRP